MLGRLMRSLFVSLSKAGWAKRLITGWGFAWRAASRFIAGETLQDAIPVIRQLNEHGIAVTLDYLGESTNRPEEARAAVDELIRALEAIEAAGLRSNVSLKLTQIGLLLDEDLCRENLARLLTRARELHTFVRIDMEDSPVTGRTLAMYDWARAQGFDNTGVVLQSYLYRSEADLAHVLEQGGRVRLVKGAYDEPQTVAYPQKAQTDASYDRLATQLLEGAMKAGAPQISADGRIPPIPAIATQDLKRIQHVQAEIKRLGVPRGAMEFQMLYGIRRDLQNALVEQGYPLRVYVPYGTQWYPYYMRRLAERPANFWFFLSNFFRR